MPTKISEKQLFLGVLLFLIGLAALLKTSLFISPVKVSERGILFLVVATVLLLFSWQFISKGIHRW